MEKITLRRRIKPRFPAWQAEILTTILPRIALNKGMRKYNKGIGLLYKDIPLKRKLFLNSSNM